MSNNHLIDLHGKVTGGASLEFLYAEVPTEHPTFIRIRYSLDGVQQYDCLPLDTGKQIFLNPFNDADEDKKSVLKRAALEIVELLSTLSAENVIKVLEELVVKGEVLIRESPLPDKGRVQVIWEAHRTGRARAFADSIGEAVLATADELRKREETG